MARKSKPEVEQTHDEKIESVQALLGVVTPDDDVLEEEESDEIELSNPFGAVATPPTLNTGHYAYVDDEDGSVICKKCGHGTPDPENPDELIGTTCDVCEAFIETLADGESK